MKLRHLYGFYHKVNKELFFNSLPCDLKLSLSKKDSDCYGLTIISWYKDQALHKIKVTIYLPLHDNDDQIKCTLVHELVHVYIALKLDRLLNKLSNLFLEHDEQIFNDFGQAAYSLGLIYQPDLLSDYED